jgi:hypothetical protein
MKIPWFDQGLENRLAYAGPTDSGQRQAPSLNALFASGSGSDEPKRTVRAGRRRPSGPSNEPRERADAPQRERPDQPAAPSSGGGYRPPAPSPSAGGGGLPGGGRMSPLMMVLGGAVFLCLVVAMAIFGGGNGGDSVDQSAFEPAAPPAVDSGQGGLAQLPADTPTPRPTRPASVGSTPGQTWTVMLYMNADDKILEQDIFVDLNEAELVGSSDRVNVVAQLDRFRGGFRGDGDWTEARRFYVTRDNDLSRIGSRMVQNVGEVNSASPDTLIDFATWAMANYPADKYVLIMSDHGMGWPGGWSDPDQGGQAASISRSPLGNALGNHMFLEQIDYAFDQIRARAGANKLEIIGMDACLMGHIEVMSALAPHAYYTILSQETEPALGWAYTAFLGELVNNPDMSGADLGATIVDTYIHQDQRILNDQARSEWVGRSPVTVRQLTDQLERNITLAVVDLAALPALNDRVNELAYQLQQAEQRDVAKARNYAQSFTNVFGSNVAPSYIDLRNFAGLLKQASRSAPVSQAVDGVLAALSDAVVSSRNGANRAGASGVSIYFPNSQLFQNPATGLQSYNVVAGRFVQESLWDEFLTFHYTGRSFDAAPGPVTAPDTTVAVRAPGAGTITLSPIETSSDVAAPGQPVLLSSDVSGDNIGHITFFTGFHDQANNAIFVADQDFLDSYETHEIDGVFYPDWGEGDFTLEVEWEPLMFAISDGQNDVIAGLTPETYGRSPEEAIYSVNGLYTYVDGEQRSARMTFQNGVMMQVFGFTGENGTAAPREILPQPGDTFTVQQQWLDLDAQGNVSGSATQLGDTLTFGDERFTWKEMDAAVGPYILGFSAQDLDGNTVATVFTTVMVE